jgi:hypothetical protein
MKVLKFLHRLRSTYVNVFLSIIKLNMKINNGPTREDKRKFADEKNTFAPAKKQDNNDKTNYLNLNLKLKKMMMKMKMKMTERRRRRKNPLG